MDGLDSAQLVACFRTWDEQIKTCSNPVLITSRHSNPTKILNCFFIYSSSVRVFEAKTDPHFSGSMGAAGAMTGNQYCTAVK